jgi:hypothetical protein
LRATSGIAGHGFHRRPIITRRLDEAAGQAESAALRPTFHLVEVGGNGRGTALWTRGPLRSSDERRRRPPVREKAHKAGAARPGEREKVLPAPAAASYPVAV